MLSVRPRIAELVFQLYGRSLHPELFEVHRTRQIERGGYVASVQITNAGHVVTWQYDGITLTEVAASAQHPLPQRRRLMSHRLKGTCTDQLECRGGVTYQVEFSLEPVERETFWTYQKELTQAGDARRPVALLRAERPVRPGRDELHQSRIARSQPQGAGVSHVPGRLRDREEPVGVRAAGEVGVVVSR